MLHNVRRWQQDGLDSTIENATVVPKLAASKRVSTHLKNEMTEWPLPRLLIRSCQTFHPLVNASCLCNPHIKVK